MEKIIFSLFDDAKIGNQLAASLAIENGLFELRSFPDDETYLRIHSAVKNKVAFILCYLDHPNTKILPLYFLSKALREQGVANITLIIPYLPYMRQDKQFNPNEAVTSHLFAELLSGMCDQLLTIDPHLHRIHHLSDIYPIPTTVLHAEPVIAEWMTKHIQDPIVIGPDEESLQWVSTIASIAHAPYVIATKQRLSDNDVVVDLPEIAEKNRTPVILDDIISSGATMRVLIKQLLKQHVQKPYCIGVHALFDEKNRKELMQAGAREVLSCNTIHHPSNQIDLFNVLLDGIKQC